jgi:D-3-phosphoglycerate dehydrogenase / 2-oxoglutarate reductase
MKPLSPALPPPAGRGRTSRIIVEPPVFTVDNVREFLDDDAFEIAAPARPWTGDDVAGLLIWEQVTAEDIERLPALRAIVTGSIGFDHIDLEAARRRGLWVCHVPDYCVEEVADTTIALLLSLVRGVVALDRSVRDGQWDDHAAGPLRTLADLRLGLVGFGRIGRAVARRSVALGVETWATDPLVPGETMTQAAVRSASFDELLAGVDAVSLHLPFSREREHLIGRTAIERMRRGSFLVNAARGQLVDVDAVVAALDSGQLAGAALDVLPHEPPNPTAIPRHPRMIVTPHAAWFSPKAEREVVRKATSALRAALSGGVPDGVVVGPQRNSLLTS